MPRLEATVIKMTQDGRARYEYPSPTVLQISVSDSYMLSPADTGSSLFDAITGIEYLFQESYSIIQGRINAAVDVALQDQTSQIVSVNFTELVVSTTLAADASIDDTEIEVTSATGIVVGQYVALFNPTAVRFSFFHVLGVVSTTITVDSPLDYPYPSGTYADFGSHDLAVNGSVTPRVFGLRGSGTPTGVDLTVDITQITLTAATVTAVDLIKFGDLAALTNGIVIRQRDGAYYNICNLISNQDIANVFGTFTPILATNPAQNYDGFTAIYGLSGQNRIGVVIRLAVGEDLELIVQDNLTGLVSFEAVAQGHVVVN